MNGRGEAIGNHMMWIWTMFLLTIAGAGLALGVSMFYGNEYDARGTESNILSSLISECISYKTLDWTKPELFYEECNLNKKVLYDEYSNTQIAIRICEQNCDNGKIVHQVGSDFEACGFKGKNQNYPKCTQGYVKGIDGKNYEIIVSSNHKMRGASS